MAWPQIAWIILVCVGSTLKLMETEPPRRPRAFVVQISAVGINVALLWAGGFWSGGAP